MGLRFIIGPAGTGKTSFCLAEISQQLREAPMGPAMVLLVPAQATFELEKALLAASGLPGFMRAQVMSFQRLAWRVLQETGGGILPVLGDTGRRMALQQIVQKRSGELRAFRRSSSQPGFVDSLAMAINEMKTQCISPGDLADQAAHLPSDHVLLKNKLQDLSLLYADYEEFLQGRYCDPGDYLTMLCARASLSPSLSGGEVWVDGFMGFTPREIEVLLALAQVMARVNVTLCLDRDTLEGGLDEQGLFYKAHQIYLELWERAGEVGVAVEEPVILEPSEQGRFRGHPGLAHLERQLLSRPRRGGEFENPVRLIAAHHRRAEVEAVARDMIALCRDQGYRWRDIAVLVRDLPAYQQLLELVLADHGIPCFIDYQRPVLGHPLVELVRSALETVAGGWNSIPLFHYLKTDLSPLKREEVDELENYVLAHGIEGSRWTDGSPWTFRKRLALDDDEERPAEQEHRDHINDLRGRAIRELADFEREAGRQGTVRGLSTALYGLLQALEVPNRLQDWSADQESRGELEKASVNAQVYNQFLELLDEMVDTFGDQEITIGEYLRLIETGLMHLKLALIPPGLDQVYVGSPERYRNPTARAVFLLGVNEGVFPARAAAPGLLTDAEREYLTARGLPLAASQKRRLFDEQYLVYFALTRASDYLEVSYALADENGDALLPSVIIRDLQAIFPGLTEMSCPLDPPGGPMDLEYLAHPERAASYLVVGLRAGAGDAPVVWNDVYNWFLTHPDQPGLERLAGLSHHNQEALSPEMARRLYGRGHMGATQLERFFACPFAHFVGYGLGARERETSEIEPTHLGIFFHEAMKRLVGAIAFELAAGRAMEEPVLRDLVADTVADLAPDLQGEVALGSERQRYLTGKLQRIIWDSARAALKHLEQGSFRPLGLEVGFGPGQKLPGIRLRGPRGESIEVAGRIDRVDAARFGTQTYLRVIDYKTGANTFRLEDVFYGLRWQLPLYLYVALHNASLIAGEPAQPGGMFYFHVHSPLIKGKGTESPVQIASEVGKRFKMSGLVLADQDLLALMDRDCGDADSTIIPAGCRRDGSFRKNASVATREEFTLLFSYMVESLNQALCRLLDGSVEIAPYQKRGRQACDLCSFRAVCQFDRLVGNRYRVLPAMNNRKAWQAIAEGREKR